VNAPDIKVRIATRDDLDTIAEIFAASFDDMQPRLAVEQFLRPRGSWALIAHIDTGLETTPAGFIVARNAADEAEVFSIGVAPQLRRRGVGRALMDAAAGVAALRGARHIYLEVGIDNQGARQLYGKAGYELVGRRPNYYRNQGGERVDALVLRQNLQKRLLKNCD